MTSLTFLYKEIQPKVYSFFYMKTGCKEVAEDLTQKVFYEAVKSFGFNPDTELSLKDIDTFK